MSLRNTIGSRALRVLALEAMVFVIRNRRLQYNRSPIQETDNMPWPSAEHTIMFHTQPQAACRDF